MKNSIQKIFNKMGYKINRFNPASDDNAQLICVLNKVDASIVFDIGANTGQFAQGLYSAGFSGEVISFEPLISAHTKLCNASNKNSSWFVHRRTAIGDYDGETEINVAGNSVSSSLLPILDAHTCAAPHSAFIKSEPTPIARLDSIAPQYLNTKSRPFIKIDTQGFEWQVLNGAGETLKLTQGVLLELSMVHLYEGQRLWREIIDRMAREGFTFWAIQRGFVDPRSGRSLQFDGLFIRE
jgi:FkbM family methyltransferase